MVNPGGGMMLDNSEFNTRFYANLATTGFTPPACGAVVDCSPPAVIDDSTGSDKGDASAFGFFWMIVLAGLAIFRHWLRPRL